MVLTARWDRATASSAPSAQTSTCCPTAGESTTGPRGYTYGQSSINLGSRVHPYVHPPNSALTNSFMTADKAAASQFAAFTNGATVHHQLGRQPSLENGLPVLDATYSGTPPAFGSPRDDDAAKLSLAPLPP